LISELSPQKALSIRLLLVTKKSLPSVIFTITHKNLDDEIIFFNHMLTKDYAWLQSSLEEPASITPNSATSQNVLALRQRLTQKLHKFKNVKGVLSSILRVYCGLGGMVNIQPSNTEVETILTVILENAHVQR
jgi:hypothetical protein